MRHLVRRWKMDFEKILTPAEAEKLGIPKTAFVISTPTAKQMEALRAAQLKEEKPKAKPAAVKRKTK